MSGPQYRPMNAVLAAEVTLKLGGITEGIILQERVDGTTVRPYRVRVYDQKVGRYRSPSFNRIADLIAFAKTTRTNFDAGIEVAGRVMMADVLPGFLATLAAKGNKPHSINEVRRVLMAADAAGVKDLKAKDIAQQAHDFLETYKPKSKFGGRRGPRSAAMRLRYVVHFRHLGRYCTRPTLMNSVALLPSNPFMALDRPKVKNGMMPIFTLEEARKWVSDEALRDLPLKRHPAGSPGAGGIEHGPLVDGVYFATRLYLGQRQKETAWLRWEHILWDEKLVKVILPDEVDHAEAVRLKLVKRGESPTGTGCERGKQVKNDKERYSILPDELAEILMKIRPASGTGYVFREEVRYRHASIDGNSFRAQLKRLQIDRPDLTPHKLRSTNACLWLAAGLGESRLKSHLGHEKIEMSSHYASRANEYRVGTKDWNGEIRLRRPTAADCNVTATKRSSAGLKGAGAPSAEDEIDDCIIAILPDNSPIFQK